MQTVIKHAGLCSNCKQAPTCTYPKDPRWPVLQCDEYECVEAGSKTAAGKDSLAATALQKGSEAKEEDSSKYMGLCSNCENRHTCVFAGREGGIWRCEEYR